VFRLSSKSPAAAAVLIGVLALAGCGESAQEKAMAQVCSARGDISKQISKLAGLTISTHTVTEAKTGFEAIESDLTKIKDAQPKLASARKEQVMSATQSFEGELSGVALSVIASVGSGNLEAALKTAGPQLKSALSKLAGDYKQSLGPISCS
jgi:hypothetical protein